MKYLILFLLLIPTILFSQSKIRYDQLVPIKANQIINTPAGSISSDNVQGALNELDGEKENAFSKNTAFNKNFGSIAGTVLEGRPFGTAANSASTDFAPATGSGNYIHNQIATAQSAGSYINGYYRSSNQGESFRVYEPSSINPYSLALTNFGASVYFGIEGGTAGGYFTGSQAYETVIFGGNGLYINSNIRTTANITATKYTSTVITGTQPYSTTSATLNTNLNADLLDGWHASSFLQSGDLTPYRLKADTVLLSGTASNYDLSFKISDGNTGWDNSYGFITGYTETDPTIYPWAKASTKPTYTYSEVGAQVAGSYLTSEVDGTNDNEGILGVGSGSGESSVILSNTAGSNGITLSVGAGGGLSITEASNSNGGSITITNTAGNYNHTGDVEGATSTTVVGINGTRLSYLSDGYLYLTSGIPSTGTPSADGNNYPTDLSFNYQTGDLSLQRSGLSTLTYSLNGRYAMLSGSSSQAFNVSTLTAQSTITATDFILSDRRLKRNIKPITFSNADQIRFYQFDMKADSSHRQRYGVIAQEVEKVMPELVHTDKDGMKAVNYTDLLIAKIVELENRIKALESGKVTTNGTKDSGKNRFDKTFEKLNSHLITCDCGGELESTNIILTSIPPLFQCKCKKCGTLKNIIQNEK